MTYQTLSPKAVLRTAIALSIASGIHADTIVYLDADGVNTVTEADGISSTDPSVTTMNAASSTDNKWNIRPFGNGLEGNPAGYTPTIYETIGDPDVPMLVTTIPGLVAGATYDVFAFFQAGDDTNKTQNWDLLAGFAPDALANYTRGHKDCIDAVATDFTTEVEIADGNRLMVQASLGTTVADASGELRVYIDANGGGSSIRTWYDGVGYEFVSGPPMDTDDDGMTDEWEDTHGLDKTDSTDAAQGGNDGLFDNDGLTNLEEYQLGTDPNDADSDDDLVDDGDEVHGSRNPFHAGHVPGEPPAGAPGAATNPMDNDSDDDGLLDGDEAVDGSGSFVSNPNSGDTDADTLPDAWEADRGLDPADDGSINFDNGERGDPDDDGLDNAQEMDLGTHPTKADTDEDGYEDGVEDDLGSWYSETETGTDPLNPDTDGDGVVDGRENPDEGTATGPVYATDPTLADSDGDGGPDGAEIAAGSDPLDVLSVIDTDEDGYTDATELAAGTRPDDASSFPQPAANALWIDFNSLANPYPQAGFQSYDATNEVVDEFTRMSYQAFGTSVGIAPSWPDTTDNRVVQMHDRGDAAAGLWSGDLPALLRDWIGCDSRTTNGGNGAYDGATGTPTSFVLTIDGLPADTYTWRSFHHDAEKMHGEFEVDISTDSGESFTPLAGTFAMTNSTPGGNPQADTLYTGIPNPGSLNPVDLPSTLNLAFTTDGTSDVLIRFTPRTTTQTHRTFFVLNGFQLTAGATVDGPLLVTGTSYDGSGNFVIDFRGEASSAYEVMKSMSLNPGSFTPLGTPLMTTTNGGGIGQAVIPAVEAADSTAFFRLEHRP